MIDWVSDIRPALTILQLNKAYDFVDAVMFLAASPSCDGHVRFRLPLSDLLRSYCYFGRKNLLCIYDRHGVTPDHRNATLDILLKGLREHVCTVNCDSIVYSFCCRATNRNNVESKLLTSVTYPEFPVMQPVSFVPYVRAAEPAQPSKLMKSLEEGVTEPTEPTAVTDSKEVVPEPMIVSDREEEFDDEKACLEVLDEEIRRSIITEWQETMSTKKLARKVCAACARRTMPHDIHIIRASKKVLSLLVNDELPPEIFPKGYDFKKFCGALLHPKGLSSVDHPSFMQVCKSCQQNIVRHKRMPKFALANWLYYGHDSLPKDVKDAFENASMAELLLVSKVRASKVCYRFDELKGKRTPSGNIAGEDPKAKNRPTDQVFNHGNVIVMPQDVGSINTVLPPSPEKVADTVCAVFVGSEKPTRQNIARLNPVLVRKKRIRTMIEFLVEKNPEYGVHNGFGGLSEENLASLHDGCENASEIPKAIEIGYLAKTDAVDVATSDYTPRRVDYSSGPSDVDGEILMENVGFTSGDASLESFSKMKMRALAHCLEGKSFVQSTAGSQLVPDFQNPHLLTSLFPQLDPWGIGGFHHRRRKVPLSLEEQLSHLIMTEESPFERDSSFAFVYYNILQKKAVYDNVRFTVSESRHKDIVRRLMKVDLGVLSTMESKFKNQSQYKPSLEAEKEILRLLACINLVGHKIPGTGAHKIVLRNEIRAMLNTYGAATMFVTVNPSDTDHPIVRLNAGEDINLEDMSRGEDLELWRQRLLVAKNPAACALFFDQMIRSFVNVVLRYGRKEKGVFGVCTAYYGIVETQGKGTLHCHMLVWLKGHFSPKELREKMVADDGYKSAMFRWLESTIQCQLFGQDEVVLEPDGEPLQAPSRKETGEPDPGTLPLPLVSHYPSPEDFRREYELVVNSLVTEFNWHAHTSTCWKYLRRGTERTDSRCRMGIDGHTRSVTTLDGETNAIRLRRLHPRISQYNDLTTFLLQCNVDVKHIGSGREAQAYLYYLTDYVTKSPVEMHVALAALSYAITRTQAKFSDMNRDDIAALRSQGTLVTTVNSMVGRQEISHQMVMAYLIGGGDHYTSDKFVQLHWGGFSRFVARVMDDGNISSMGTNLEPLQTVPNVSGVQMSGHKIFDDMEVENAQGTPEASHSDAGYAPQELPSMSVEKGGCEVAKEGLSSPLQPIETDIATTLQSVNVMEADTALQPIAVEGENHSAAEGEKEYMVLRLDPANISASSQRYDYVYRSDDQGIADLCLYDFITRTSKVKMVVKADQPLLIRGRFNSKKHPQFGTHHLKIRARGEVVPVILGETIKAAEQGCEGYDRWARAMLILFKPWRVVSDLKVAEEAWGDAYLKFEPAMKERHRKIVRNMNVMSECRDARDLDMTHRASRNSEDSPLQADPLSSVYDDVRLVNELEKSFDVFERPDHKEDVDFELDTGALDDALQTMIGKPEYNVLTACVSSAAATSQFPEGAVSKVDAESSGDVLRFQEVMRVLKLKRKRVSMIEDGGGSDDSERKKKRRLHREKPPLLAVADIDLRDSQDHDSPADPFDAAVEDVVAAKGLQNNPEQLRAFRIVALHLKAGKAAPLMLYVGGIGGTGKSYVIECIVLLFERLGRSNELLLSAPTGAAAVVIGGQTLHSLAMLGKDPKKNGSVAELRKLWEGIKYLIIDEVSMVGGRLLSMLSQRMKEAKGEAGGSSKLPFGGVSVIFTGDFGQLKPVPPQYSLYSHKIIMDPSFAEGKDQGGVSAMQGAFLWRQVTDVVQLTQNVRQKGDTAYAGFLSRLRSGECADGPRGGTDDLCMIRDRQLGQVIKGDEEAKCHFADAPVIVGTRKLRDTINAKLVDLHAKRLDQTVWLYQAKDKSRAGFDQKALLQLSPKVTNDMFGRLPLFPGMRVMVTTNISVHHKLVNGAEGVVEKIFYDEDADGNRFAQVVHVRVKGAGKVAVGLEDDIVPIVPITDSFEVKVSGAHGKIQRRSVSRLQVPLMPAYCYTDYKSQGRSLEYAIVDLKSAGSLQGVYVMLSRVKSLKGVAVLRGFPREKIICRTSQELRMELARLNSLDSATNHAYRHLI